MYNVMVTETTIYNDGRKAKQNVEKANSFRTKSAAYAYLDGIQEWNEEEINVNVYRTKRSYLTINYSKPWGIINLSYTIRKVK